ncbi:MAG: sigma-70 family RNA polymerase sigma factor [Polyangiaceae bacterium]|nr:sigma-70 family RNA polymerase sigma factor [Polyangiaceae bacterium]
MRSDEALMAAYVGGEAAAFRELFDRHAPSLLRSMRRDLRSPEEAADLVQQCFLQLHRARNDFDPAQRLRPWLFTIALNLKREYFRRVKRRPEAALEVANEPHTTHRGAERLEAAQALARAFAEVPVQQREVIELHWFDELSFHEIAQVLGATVSAVKVRAHRGYARLRELLSDIELPAGALPLDEPTADANGNPAAASDIGVGKP